MTIKIIENIEEMQHYSLKMQQEGKTVALVPTMGYLHEGHASLMKEGRCRADLLVTSIFVNPTQFGVNEDFAKYPRDMERDHKIAATAGVDIIFAPAAAAMYPDGYQTYVDVEKLTLTLCGASRLGHFRGVTTVVCKLFGIVQPHLALFGRKDYQQLAVIRQMTADLNLPVDIIGMPIVREADGLAMSSRNAYLSASERQSALCLHRGLQSAMTAYRQGERSIAQLVHTISAAIASEESVLVDYIQLLDGATLEPVSHADGNTLAAVAVRIGKTRLIDNSILGEE